MISAEIVYKMIQKTVRMTRIRSKTITVDDDESDAPNDTQLDDSGDPEISPKPEMHLQLMVEESSLSASAMYDEEDSDDYRTTFKALQMLFPRHEREHCQQL
jgi:hypothetical protein